MLIILFEFNKHPTQNMNKTSTEHLQKHTYRITQTHKNNADTSQNCTYNNTTTQQITERNLAP